MFGGKRLIVEVELVGRVHVEPGLRAEAEEAGVLAKWETLRIVIRRGGVSGGDDGVIYLKEVFLALAQNTRSGLAAAFDASDVKVSLSGLVIDVGVVEDVVVEGARQGNVGVQNELQGGVKSSLGHRQT